MPRARYDRSVLLICAGLVVATLMVYWPTLRYGFLTWDDNYYLVNNPNVYGGLSWKSVYWAFTTGYFTIWHPLTWLSYLLDFDLHGMKGPGFHLTNVLLHTANSVLLFLLLWRMTDDRRSYESNAKWKSAFVAALFAVHPLHVESVAWVAERKDVLSTFFWILTMWAYVVYIRDRRPAKYALVLLLFAAALMSKPMAVTLPFVLLLLDFWPLRRFGVAHEKSSDTTSAARLIVEKLPLLALAAVASVIAVVVHQQAKDLVRFEALPLGARIGNAMIAYLAYIGKTIWPTKLAAFYPYSQTLPTLAVAGSALTLLVILALVIWKARSAPYMAFGWLWYLGTLVPVIGFVQVGGQAMADRYSYIPSIGLYIMVAWGIGRVIEKSTGLARPAGITAALVMGACGVLAAMQVRHWRSNEALWRHALAVGAESHFAHNSLGEELAKKGDYAEASEHYYQALRINPHLAEAHNNLGAVFEYKGDLGNAIAQYSEAVRSRADFAEAHYNLAHVESSIGATQIALHHYREALRINPTYADAHNNMGVLLERDGKFAEARDHYFAALQLRPDVTDFHFNAARIHAREGNIPEATRQLQLALSVDPNSDQAREALEDLIKKTAPPSKQGIKQSITRIN